MMRHRLPDALIIALLFALPLIMFWQQTLGGRTLLPTENLYQYEPYATYREQVGAPAIPHNALLSDLVLQNMQWKLFIRESIHQGELPLWNPHQFSGIPFLAAGQQSTLYPLSLIYYVLPLPAAYGWFTVIQLWLAGVFMVAFLRGLGSGRFGAALAGIVYQLAAFFVVSAVFPMIIGAAAWLPLILLMTELVIRQQPALRNRPASVPWVLIGATALGCNILAGHVEITYYTLIITAYYAAARLVALGWAQRRAGAAGLRRLGMRAFWLAAMVLLGLSLGAVQFIPLFEFASLNYRDGRSSLEQILNWAHPLRGLAQFILPNFYGNPAHHAYVDVFTGQTVPATVNALGQPITTIDWGIKNYVEGALYLGILPLALALYALLDSWLGRRPSGQDTPPYRILFALLTGVGLTFMFGLPTYALLYYTLPGINQLHSPFRWIFAVTLGVAALAGFGADRLASMVSRAESESGRTWARRIGWALVIGGGVTLAALPASRLLFAQIEPLVDAFFRALARAPEAFADARMFYSYQFTNVLTLGVMLLGAGAVFVWAGRAREAAAPRRWPGWQWLACGLVALDLMIASWNFNPASDPALLDFTPPAVAWLQAQPGDWRYTTIDNPQMGERGKIMNANMGWRYGLDDIRGYESIIPKTYVNFMRQLAPQVQLDFNRVSPLYPDAQYAAMNMEAYLTDILRSPLIGLLNVRFVISSADFSLPAELTTSPNPNRVVPLWRLAYEDEAVRIWERSHTARAVDFLIPAGEQPRLEQVAEYSRGDVPVIASDTGRELVIHSNLYDHPNRWLVVSTSYVPDWRAFVRPRGGDDTTERPLPVEPVFGSFIGVNLSPDALAAAFDPMRGGLAPELASALVNRLVTVRLVYSPASFQVGLFGSFIGGVLLVFLAGVYAWRLLSTPDEQASGAAVVAKNSLAPIMLNLFNRGIDFGFAFIMLRVLGPEGAGIYYYAIFIFGWFEIFTNFGLNVFLTREVARDRSRAWRLLYNTSVLRLLLALAGVPLLIGFLVARQAAISPALPAEAILAILLLYIGLLPNSLSTGLSALFYAFEKAEYPAAIATLATINKAVLGVAALMLGLGAVGLAGVSIITNLVTLAVMIYTGRSLFERSRQAEAAGQSLRPDARLVRSMTGESWPLMLNHFLATIFFQVDVVIIEALHGARMVGQYSVAYKWVSALNVIPAFFTMALLPVMSRQAREDRAALKRSYALAIKLLLSAALPLAVLFTFLAYFLTGVLGGAEFLPDGAIATQLMIWSIPIGWMNSLTQYVLIALDLQRRITRAFVIGVSFNIITNLLFIPQYGYQAAAITTIFSELALFIVFALLLKGTVGPVNYAALAWRPALAALALGVVLWVGWPLQPIITLALGVAVYGGVLLALRPLDADEWGRLLPLIPNRLRRLAAS